MKGTLHKTGSGWQVWYYAKEDLFYGNTGVRILPLHPDAYSVNGPMKDVVTSWEGQEVEFEIVEFPVNSISKYAKLVDKATRPVTEDDAWLTMKEGDITVNFKPMPEFDEPAYPTRQISLLDSVRANPSWDTIIREFHIATQQVPKGAPLLIFECWLVENYNPPTKKQD